MDGMKIYCPNCNRNVGDWDGKTKTSIEVKCKKCSRLVVFSPISKKAITKPLPKPNTASGRRLY